MKKKSKIVKQEKKKKSSFWRKLCSKKSVSSAIEDHARDVEIALPNPLPDDVSGGEHLPAVSAAPALTEDHEDSPANVLLESQKSESVFRKKFKNLRQFLRSHKKAVTTANQDISDEEILPNNPVPSLVLDFFIEEPIKNEIASGDEGKDEKMDLKVCSSSFKVKKASHKDKASTLELHKWEMEARFASTRKLGAGAFGSVYRIQEKKTKKVYALKTIQGTPRRLFNVPNEIDAIIKTSQHPLFLSFHGSYSYDYQDGTEEYGILTEMYNSRNLNNLKIVHPLRQVDSKFILFQLGNALKYLHTLKIIHCDVKCENILVNNKMKIKLIDFGNSQKGPHATIRSGTLGFLAPEVECLVANENRRPYSYAVDYYAVGAVLHDILYGRPPPKSGAFLDIMQNLLSYSMKIENTILPRKHFGYKDDITKEDITFAAKLLNYCPEARPNDQNFLIDMYFDNLPGKLKAKMI